MTVAGHENPHNVENHVSGHAPSLLTTIASVFATMGSNNTWVHDGEVFIVLCPEHAQSIAGDGWTRRDVQDFLFNEAQLPLARLHYRDFPDYPFFGWPARAQPRTFNLHVCQADTEMEHRHLRFRDRLRADDQLRDEYARLKRELAAQHGNDVQGYTDAKDDFIRTHS